MELTKHKIKITYNNNEVKYATIWEIARGLPKSRSYPVKFYVHKEIFGDWKK